MFPRRGVQFARLAALLAAAVVAGHAATAPQPVRAGEEVKQVRSQGGRHGGRLVVTLKAEPKTLNPVTAVDAPSREVLGRMMGDLVHINRVSHRSEPALAKSWKISADGRRYTLRLRRGLRFSDGHPFTADDVLFTFRVYSDAAVASPHRDLLMVGGKPVAVRKLDGHTVVFELARPYAAAERLFDSVAILPRHLLEKEYQAGRFAQAWPLNSEPARIAGLGPFRLKEYVPGQRVVLERNPYYWKADEQGARLPYLDELVFLIVPNEDAQLLRFKTAQADVISRLTPESFALLEREPGPLRLYDLGPGLEYNFLFFNLNSKLPEDGGELRSKQAWFQDARFRRAVSLAVDRQGMNRLVYRNRGAVLWTHVTPAYRSWGHPQITVPPRSVERARELLREAGFRRQADGTLADGAGQRVEFTIVTSASNAQRTQMATMIQHDLKALGMQVQVVSLEFRALLDRIFHSRDYEAAVLGLGGGDVDPNPQMNVWLSSGRTHLWHLGQTQPATAWEAEIDRLMRAQLTTLDAVKRRKMYHRLQELVAEHQPIICLVSPNVLVGANQRVGNFKPAILDHYTLWNADELYVRDGPTVVRR